MIKIQFEVQGSAPDPYIVTFIKRSDNKISAYCSCPAGENGLYCKHRLNILSGIEKDIVSGNNDDVHVVKTWLLGTDLELAIIRVQELEKEAERIKKELSSAKRNLVKVMHD